MQTLLAEEDGRKGVKVPFPLSIRPPPQVKSARRLGKGMLFGNLGQRNVKLR